jgi:dolichol-phosphate mannosyltransferase
MVISVVFSFYNEEDNIPELVRRVRAALRPVVGREYEMIFVNDRSTDNSLTLLKAEADREHDVKIVNMSRNFGVSVCALAGMRYAKGDVVIYLDADLQDPPELIPTLLETWKREQADVVHTVRTRREGENPVKLLITKIGYRILRKLSNIHLTENAGDYKLLSRRAVDHLLTLQEKQPFLRGLVVWVGFKQTQVQYVREPRFKGATKFPVFGHRVIGNFLESALISFSDVPLKVSLIIGFIIAFGAFIYLLIVVVMKLMGYNLPGWSAIMVTMLMLGGIQLITIGMLGLYINSIYLETKKRPNYIVESAYGFDNEMRD